MVRTRIVAFILTLSLIVPMLFLPNSLGFYIRDPKESMDPEKTQKPVLGLFEQSTFSYMMLFVIEGFYYFFFTRNAFPYDFFYYLVQPGQMEGQIIKGMAQEIIHSPP